MTEANVKRGKKSRASGAAFELRVRKDLEDKGWTVDKWGNNVEDNKLVKAKTKWAGPNRPMMMGAGFPDYIAFRELKNETTPFVEGESYDKIMYEIIGVESKINGKLDREEKEKAHWYLKNKIFSKILIASKEKVKNKIVINYTEFNCHQ